MKHKISTSAAVRKINNRRSAAKTTPTQTRAGAFVARRYRVSPLLAEVIARLAGFNQEVAR